MPWNVSAHLPVPVLFTSRFRNWIRISPYGSGSEFYYTNPDPRIRIHITEFSAGPWWAKIELFVLRNNITMSFQECFPWPGCGERGDHLGHEIFGGGSCKFSVPVLHLQLRISEGLRHPVHYPPALGGQARRAWHQVHHQQKGQTWQKW